MTQELNVCPSTPLCIGAVGYLNSQPLTLALESLVPRARIEVDLPSRLADGLAAGRFDVALVPSIEYFRHADWTIVSDACIACDGPVQSVKLLGRVPVQRIRTLALDEGSRTSAAAARIMLKERFGMEPKLEKLAIDASPQTPGDMHTDAILLIGDRAMRQPEGRFEFAWDLGDQWSRWTGLPLVFAMWVARPGTRWAGLADRFADARDQGFQRVEEIARHEAPRLNLSETDCLTYLRDRLIYQLGPREREGLERLGRLAAFHQLIPNGERPLVFAD